MTDSSTIVVLSTPTCGGCRFVINHLKARGVDYEKIDVTQDEEWRRWMVDRNLTKVPQTIKGDDRVEGADIDAINRLF